MTGRAWQRARAHVEPRDVVMVLLVAACLVFTSLDVSASDRKFCDVIHGFTAVQVQQPADPAANPSRENQWLWYQRFVSLGRSLGCLP